MSRRPNPAADRAEQNRTTLKNLVKLEGNKTCSDCKRNKHPRWASWNLGVFICIRCSGIHRGMGTHISRVKSVDLDTWTDEQLQSVLRWGNARANKYWEAKLAPGHVPSEAKIENFIRTKYESKRWVMDGPLPDPSTLDVDDDDMPLKKVQEKVQLERSTSQRLAGGSTQLPPPQARQQPVIDLFGDETPAPPRPNTQPPVGVRSTPSRAEAAPPKPTNSALLGMDFLGGASSQPARPASTGPASAASSRPDLKQSILSLYASAPKPAQPQQQQHARQESFGSLAQTSPQQSSFGGMNDAFSSLSFAAQPAAKPSPFSGLDSFSSTKSPSTTSSSNMFGGGGNFFDAKPKSPPATQTRTMSPGNFSAFSTPAPSKPAAAPVSNMMNDLLDLSMAAPPAQSAAAFNLSPAAPTPAPAPAPAPSGFSNFSSMDAWGSSSNDVWGSSAPAQPAHSTNTTNTVHAAPKSPGWGAPAVAQDDDFGGWSSAAPTHGNTSTATGGNAGAAGKSGGFGGGDDLFSNVWE
ncbi:ArfGap-domain-containing protein [Dothidotthia symphoricarpi CBS 119687]|uniref:ArfGap-domain-containing protein n=1 Tax=Dothidotthia symphoricarpi CBS 119687 TaxID=1392245 RepID=A0A6A5ZXX1_9PLEO|nr:ArfGap-domain-containing protein [Dothidotthia symphoricarpi CBS 119687]KAF2123865.1 ArfGap-domain-containing protein [Dothidotthia symphoricarpi CBS 119687]